MGGLFSKLRNADEPVALTSVLQQCRSEGKCRGKYFLIEGPVRNDCGTPTQLSDHSTWVGKVKSTAIFENGIHVYSVDEADEKLVAMTMGPLIKGAAGLHNMFEGKLFHARVECKGRIFNVYR